MQLKLSIIFLFLTLTCFGTTVKVTRIIDGDTFETETGEKVRLIGINAPEITDIFGQEAKQHLLGLIEGKVVELQFDHISKVRDSYDRLLGYVVLNGVDINKQMITDGFAFAYLKYRFDKPEEYKQAQFFASNNKNGIWGDNNKAESLKQIKALPQKVYFVISLVVILLFMGVYYYFKK